MLSEVARDASFVSDGIEHRGARSGHYLCLLRQFSVRLFVSAVNVAPRWEAKLLSEVARDASFVGDGIEHRGARSGHYLCLWRLTSVRLCVSAAHCCT